MPQTANTGQAGEESVVNKFGPVVNKVVNKRPPKSRQSLSMRVNGCQCDHTERRRVRSMDKGESEEKNGRDGEIRTLDLLTPSQAR